MTEEHRYVARMREVRDHRYVSKMREVTYSNLFMALIWLAFGTLAVLIPVISRSLKMKNYNNMYYMYNWEDANQDYQQQQQGYYQDQYQNQNQYQNNNYYNNDGSGYTNWEQMTGKWDLNQCSWYQISCYPYYINDNGQPVPTEGWYPGWFSGWSDSVEEREEMMENGETTGAMKFVYGWQIFMFVILLAYGFVVIRQKRIVTGLLIALFMFTNMSFLSMWMLADGSIYTDGDYVQRDGFYGQFPVLMFMTNAWYVFFGLIFLVVFGFRARRMNKEVTAPTKQIQQEQHDTYKTLEAGSGPALDHNGESYVPVRGALS